MADEAVRIAVIGGSGLYNMPGLTDREERSLSTPFGAPSDAIVIGSLNGVRVAFLGVERIIAISACGSLREDYAPGHIVVPDQLYDNTKDRRGRSFFGDGLAVHIGVANPFCPDLSRIVLDSVREVGGVVHGEGAFVTIEGPRFSTRAESNVFRSWGMSIIGMTTSPEAFLAREAEMCYAVMAHVTDYDVWHESEQPVTVDMVVRTLNANMELAQRAIAIVVDKLAGVERECECRNALAEAIITDRRKIPGEVLERLGPIVSKYLPRS
jgi:5'-methylthioadenosine phosphorylase